MCCALSVSQHVAARASAAEHLSRSDHAADFPQMPLVDLGFRIEGQSLADTFRRLNESPGPRRSPAPVSPFVGGRWPQAWPE